MLLGEEVYQKIILEMETLKTNQYLENNTVNNEVIKVAIEQDSSLTLS